MIKYLILAIFSSVLLSLAWPTYGFPFFIFVALVPLLMMEHKITISQEIKNKSWIVFCLSYISFMIWNICTTGWLYGSKNPDGSNALLAVVFPVLVNSFLMSSTFQFFHFYKKRMGEQLGVFFFIAIWMCFEKFHMEWEFTWPWLNLGNVFAEYPELVQWYDTFGATGGSFWILLVNVLIFNVLNKKEKSIKNIMVVVTLIVFPMGVSLFKYYQYEPKSTGKVKVMMLQPNLDPYTEKYVKDSIQIVDELLTLAKQNTNVKIDYYLAPETAFPGTGSISERGLHHNKSIFLVNEFLKSQPHSIFMGGVSTYKIFNELEKPKTATFYPKYGVWLDSYNSAMQIIPNQEPKIYHKGKLVPGVEIFPYMSLLKPLLGNAMLNFGGTVASLGIDEERKVFHNQYNKGKIAPIICYESIYGEYVTDYIQKEANFLGIVTNDSWWGVTEGHRQLLSYARLRAIETRREIARAANSGISAHINAKGDILSHTKYGEKTVLIADIQLYDEKTIYTKIGDIFSKISVFGVIVLMLMIFFRKNKL